MSVATPNILFVHNHPTRFVQIDMELLREKFQVTEMYLRSKRLDPLSIFNEVAKHDVVFGWFSSWHTFLPMLFAKTLRKPSLLIVGGHDLANQPEYGYGHQRGGVKKVISRWNMRLARCLVTNAHFSRREAEQNAAIDKEAVQVVYHGVPDLCGELSLAPRSKMALTVGNVCQENLARKGHEPFVRAARLLPDVEFVLAGEWRDDAIEHLRAIATPNVTFTGWLDDNALTELYRRASVYLQVSTHEGFGMSLAEAMLAGCIPIVTNIGAIPEVVGDSGIYVSTNEKAIAEAVRNSLSLPIAVREGARQRIKQRFTLLNRREAFERLISNMLNQA